MELKQKQISRNFEDEVDEYWLSKGKDEDFICPNVALFRFIGSTVGKLQNKNVLEVGFAHGADLMECKRRGANIVGLDLNPNFVEDVKTRSKCDSQIPMIWTSGEQH